MTLYHLVSNVSDILRSTDDSMAPVNNNVSLSLEAGLRERTVTKLLQKLLSIAGRKTRSGQITIGAKRFHNVILVQIRHRDETPEDKIEKEIAEAAALAASIGGCVYVSPDASGYTMMTFSFLDSPAVLN